MEKLVYLILMVVSYAGLIFGITLAREVRAYHRKPKDNRTYGKGVNKDDYR